MFPPPIMLPSQFGFMGNYPFRVASVPATNLEHSTGKMTFFCQQPDMALALPPKCNRTEAMALMMILSAAERSLRIFLNWGNMCDAPWEFRSTLADQLRSAVGRVELRDFLQPEERAFYSELPSLIAICEVVSAVGSAACLGLRTARSPKGLDRESVASTRTRPWSAPRFPSSTSSGSFSTARMGDYRRSAPAAPV